MKLSHILILIVLLGAAFFAGRTTAPKPEVRTVVEYVKQPTINISKNTPDLKPVSVDMPRFIILAGNGAPKQEIDQPSPSNPPIQPPFDSITMSAYVETAKDWNLTRRYSEVLFDNDTIGKAVFNASVQFNSLTAFDYTFTPVSRVVTQTILNPPPMFGGYAVATVTTRNAGVGVGVRYGKFGVHALAGYDYAATAPIYGGGIMVLF